MGKSDKKSGKSSKHVLKLKKRTLEEGITLNDSDEHTKAFVGDAVESQRNRERERKAKVTANKLHKRKQKGLRSYDCSNNVVANFCGDKDAQIVEENRSKKSDSEKKASKRKRKRVKESEVDDANVGKLLKRSNRGSNNLISNAEKANGLATQVNQYENQGDTHSLEVPEEENGPTKTRKDKTRKDKRRRIKACTSLEETEEHTNATCVEKVAEISRVGEDCSKGRKAKAKKANGHATQANKYQNQDDVHRLEVPEKANDSMKTRMDKAKKGKRRRTKARAPLEEMEENANASCAEKVAEISGVDEDCSKGMKKWLIEYKDKRPGLKVLQARLDEFISAHEAQQDQARKEREALAAEGGWTVVVHHKDRKRTTDVESGITVGSVSEAAAKEKIGKKKNLELQDFYRFQKKEAQRNEIMMLQTKFEHDKKRIQQLRAARKFRPY